MKPLNLSELSEGVTFDDVLLVPQYSPVLTRSHVDTSTSVAGFILSVPVVSSPMDSITEFKMAEAMWQGGGLGILHRYMPVGVVVNALVDNKGYPIVPSVGVKDEDLLNAERYIKAGATAICLDIAHGHSQLMGDAIKAVRRMSQDVQIIAGNVATGEGAYFLAEAGANVIRCGVGSGAICSTRLQTGHGVPQISCINDCSLAVSERFPNVKILSDGGVRHIGDMAKAIAAGADAVMTGFMFAGCNETPNPHNYRGMASVTVQLEHRGNVSNGTPEGVSFDIVPHGLSAVHVLQQIQGGLRSACSYTGALTLAEFQAKAKFMKVSAHTHLENATRSKT